MAKALRKYMNMRDLSTLFGVDRKVIRDLLVDAGYYAWRSTSTNADGSLNGKWDTTAAATRYQWAKGTRQNKLSGSVQWNRFKVGELLDRRGLLTAGDNHHG